MDTPTAEGSRIENADTRCDDIAAQAMTIPTRAVAIKYVHNRWCSRLTLASCRCRSLKRRAYSSDGVSCGFLEASLIEFLSFQAGAPDSMLRQTTRVNAVKMAACASDREGATAREEEEGVEKAWRDLVHLQLRLWFVIALSIFGRGTLERNRGEERGERLSAISRYSPNEQRQMRANRLVPE